MIGLTQSPFILQETVDAHFHNCGQEFQDYRYVDDLVIGGESINEA